ncbi:MAG: zinc ABC transporter substrate-binding protein [Caldilinea sp.]|nr:zinc ABC transporter substrate-binding protein [Caldilinea sp.]MDW8440669.1 zinc ABC transporter substrate-binding protein [Caldilineaceae bacterium]
MQRFLGVLLILALSLSACAATPTAASNGKLTIVTTTGMIADIVRNVGGERVQVTALMGPGVDPHLYKASEGDVRRLQSAKLIFYNGLHLEAQLGEVLKKMNDFGVTTVAVAEGIDPGRLLAHPTYPDLYDPHIWFDVTLWMQAVERVKEALIAADPDHADEYEANTAAYLKELETLHQYVLSQAAKVPTEKRVLITAHDAFHYFGRAYGFEVRGLQGISTEAQPGAADVQNLAAFIVERRIPAIFVETSVPQRNIEAVQAAVQARGFDVRLGGALFSDAMGEEGTPEGTYIGMVKHNIDTIVRALLETSHDNNSD